MHGSEAVPFPFARSMCSCAADRWLRRSLSPPLRDFFFGRSVTKSPARRSRFPATVPGTAVAAAPPPPAPRPARSLARVVLAAAHPALIPPITASTGTRASVRNTSLNIAWPVISYNGRSSTPSWCMSMAIQVMPRCLGASGSVRARSIPRSAVVPREVHTFWPLMIHSSPSSTALVVRPARSEPAPGSENNWHQAFCPVTMSRT